MAKYVFITGGVVSGLGKGITAGALGALLKARGYKVTLQKIDPYFNVDSSNLSPYQHGEVFVTGDGAETDLVIGHYERLLGENLFSHSEVTSGQIYSSVIAKERQGEYDGGTVQVVPHITDEIKSKITALSAGESDIIITEIGGTVGDIECHPFLEAIRQLRSEVGRANVAYVHVTLLPYIESSGEQKTKPTQHSVKELQNVGIQPDIIVCRSEYPIGDGSKKKLSLFCNVSQDCIIQDLTTEKLYSVPLMLEQEGFAKVVLRRLHLEDKTPDLKKQTEFCEKSEALADCGKSVKIAVVGKYVEKHDAYVSLSQALFFGGVNNGVKVDIKWVSSESVTQTNAKKLFGDVGGIVIPSGFGERGFDGKIAAAIYARKNDVPCLMIGLGAQAGIVEYAKNELNITDAADAEFSSAGSLVIDKFGSGLTCKKGEHKTLLVNGSMLKNIYGGADVICERHRHKYQINKDYKDALSAKELKFTGFSEHGTPEAFEIQGKKFYVGVIFQPEFTARPSRPAPLFDALISAAYKNL